MNFIRVNPQYSFLREQLIIAALLAVTLGFGFYFLGGLNAERFADGHLSWDISLAWGRRIPFRPGWIWGSLLYFPVCFLPLLFREVRQEIGVFRRTALGFASQYILAAPLFILIPLKITHPEISPGTASETAALWFYGIDQGFNIFPSLHIANTAFLACLTARLRGGLLGSMAWMSVILIAVSDVFVDKHYLLDLPAGLLLGVLCYRLAFSRTLDFIEMPRIWPTILFELTNLKSIFIANDMKAWEAAYRSGHWDFLKSCDQRPRHYTIGGLVQDHFPEGADILDVGCGEAILYPFIKSQVQSYTAIDISQEAIRKCRKSFKGDKTCTFEVRDFQNFQTHKRYDAIILNEVLYYFPWTSIPNVLKKVRCLIKGPGSLLIISMNKNLKARILWRIVHQSILPIQSLRVENTFTGSYWTVRVYSPAQKSPPEKTDDSKKAGVS